MMMNTFFSRTVNGFFAIFLVLTSTASLANQTLDEQRLSAARRLILEAGIADLYVQGAHKFFADTAKTNPARKNEMAWKTGQVTVMEATQRLAPIYAEFLSANQANELRTFFTTSAGQKFWNASSRAALQGLPFNMPKLSAQEHRQVLSFTVSNNTWREFSQAQPAIQRKMADTAQLWARDLGARYLADFGRQIADAVTGNEGALNSQGSTYSADSPEQQLIAAFRNFGFRSRTAVTQYQNTITKLELGTVMSAESLVSRDGIVQSRAKLDAFEQELNRHLREHNAMSEEIQQAFKRIAQDHSTGSSFLERLEKNMTSRFERALRTEENQRALIYVLRQMLNLADERFGKIKYSNNQLLFEDDQDLFTYRELQHRFKKEVDVEAQLDLEEQQLRQAALRQLLGEPEPGGLKP